jgi:glycosyltransferase involved in cell wall biosynthesis
VRISVIIPAFNEEVGLARVLHGLTDAADFGPDLDVIVVPNGCTDSTADVARKFAPAVRVVEMDAASKTAALNAGDAAADGDVRIYLDADTAATPSLLRSLASAATSAGAQAAVPALRLDLDGSSWPVRAYYAVNSRLPIFQSRLFGRGVIAMSSKARARFPEFPDISADDLFLDALVRADEKREIDVVVPVRVPRRAGDLIRRLARSRRGNAEFYSWAAQHETGLSLDLVSDSRRGSWLRDVVLPAPQLWPAAVCYITIIGMAYALARMPGWSARSGWGRARS